MIHAQKAGKQVSPRHSEQVLGAGGRACAVGARSGGGVAGSGQAGRGGGLAERLRGRQKGRGGGNTHPVTPRRPGSAVQVGGLEDESKWQVFKAVKKQQQVQ